MRRRSRVGVRDARARRARHGAPRAPAYRLYFKVQLKPVGMNITRRPPQGLERQGRTGGYSYQRDWVQLL